MGTDIHGGFDCGLARRDAQPAVAQGNQTTIIQDERVDSSIMSRAIQHPTVLEIMAACAEIIETESSAVVGPEYDGSTLRTTAKRLLEQAARIRESDPDIWEDCPLGGIAQTAPSAAINEQLLAELKIALKLVRRLQGIDLHYNYAEQIHMIVSAIAAAEAAKGSV